ncbi:MAG TPA: hypothetical protein VFN42_06105 [Acetobacteraceae bacterium]|nr:hypothetical protein [Acetobacteraceae bacterium]
MTLPFALPDWLPWWVPVLLMIPALLYALAFLFMPFSVIGVKGRLDVLDARLDEIQNEIRHLALRMPEAAQQVDFEEVYAPEPRVEPSLRAAPASRPPIPPALHELEPEDQAPAADRPAPAPTARPLRREPRLDWPR